MEEAVCFQSPAAETARLEFQVEDAVSAGAHDLVRTSYERAVAGVEARDPTKEPRRSKSRSSVERLRAKVADAREEPVNFGVVVRRREEPDPTRRLSVETSASTCHPDHDDSLSSISSAATPRGRVGFGSYYSQHFVSFPASLMASFHQRSAPAAGRAASRAAPQRPEEAVGFGSYYSQHFVSFPASLMTSFHERGAPAAGRAASRAAPQRSEEAPLAGRPAPSDAKAKGRKLLLRGLRTGEVGGIIDKAEAAEAAEAAKAICFGDYYRQHLMGLPASAMESFHARSAPAVSRVARQKPDEAVGSVDYYRQHLLSMPASVMSSFHARSAPAASRAVQQKPEEAVGSVDYYRQHLLGLPASVMSSFHERNTPAASHAVRQKPEEAAGFAAGFGSYYREHVVGFPASVWTSFHAASRPGAEVEAGRSLHSAFVFIKPHAVCDKVRSLAKRKFTERGLRVTSEGEIAAEVVDRKQLIDTHYGAIAEKAVKLKPETLTVSPKAQEAFQKAFGVSWSDALTQGLVYNAMDAAAKLGITPAELNPKWLALKKDVDLLKFSGGFYCGKVDGIYVINGFYLAMRTKFTTPGTSIYYYTVEWDPAQLSWADFRAKVLGTTEPKAADDGSLRNTIYKQWKELGLRSAPSLGDNGFHASASPFEALAERANWLGVPLEQDYFAKAMVASGVPLPMLRAWCDDPPVIFEGHKQSLFDSLEDFDGAECLQKAAEIATLQAACSLHSAFVFIKPHAVCDKVKELVREKFTQEGIRVASEGEIAAEAIDRKQLIDTHFGAIALKAVELKPESLIVHHRAREAFRQAFGLSWSDALKQGLVYNAMDAAAKLGITPVELNPKWLALKKDVDLLKFSGGFYCGRVDGIYVVNGFYLAMRTKFTAPGTSIHYYVVEWDPKRLSWADFRAKVLGSTEPKAAEQGSLRNAIYKQWGELGLQSAPNIGDNGFHASASPFEALAERANWLGAPLESDYFAKAMLMSGVPLATLRAWCHDPPVTFEGKRQSLFDLLEDLDGDECLQKAADIAVVQAELMSRASSKHSVSPHGGGHPVPRALLAGEGGGPSTPSCGGPSTPSCAGGGARAVRALHHAAEADAKKEAEVRHWVETARSLHTAFVFIKPHAVHCKVKGLAREKFSQEGIRVASEGEIAAEAIDRKHLVDTHYGAVATKAVKLKPHQLMVQPRAQEAFQKAFGLSWNDALKQGLVYNAMDAASKLGITPAELNPKWAALKKDVDLLKFSSGFYCGKVDDIYVINGFYLATRTKFTTPGSSIHYYAVEWDPKKLSWADFRAKVLGGTEPKAADAGSLRNTIYRQWGELGLRSAPDLGDNGFHVSASPFEALAERANWLGAPLESDYFAKAMLASGVPLSMLRHWCDDPPVSFDGRKQSLFDLLEDLDGGDCLRKAADIVACNRPVFIH